MVGFIYFSVDGVLAPLFDIFAQISYVGLLGLSNVHLGIFNFSRHILYILSLI